MSESMNILVMDHVSVRRGSFLLKDVSLTVKKKEIHAILGKTGAGKSVLLESAAGLDVPEKGTVFYRGRDVRSIPLHRRNIGYLYQDLGLFPHMTARENIEFGLRVRHAPAKTIRKKADELAEMLEIRDRMEQYPGTMSGGEQQRTALARAMITEPELLLLDEPFSALDPVTKQKMRRLILRLREQYACAVVFVTHSFSDAEQLSDRVSILLDGVLRGTADTDQMYCSSWDSDTRRFLGIIPENKGD